MGEETKIKTAPSRNYSLDLLRIISMFMVVCLHILSHGGVLETAKGSYNYYFLLLLRDCCIIAVNLYVVLSSYFLVTQRFRPSKLLRLYLEVVFWCAIGYIFGIVRGADGFAIRAFVFETLCPFSFRYYWFVSAYAILYLLSPILNFLIKKLTRRQHLAVCVGLFLAFSLWVDVYPNENYFNLSGGYSVGWFMVLYFIGSYLRLHAKPEKWNFAGGLYFASAICILAIQIILPVVSDAINLQSLWKGHFGEYNSVLVVFETLFLFVAFLKLDIKQRFWQKVIEFISPLTLGVYLIHENGYFRTFLWQNIVRTQDFPHDSILLIFFTIGFAFLVFIACLLLSFVRKLVFSIWEKRKFWRSGLEKFDNFVIGTLYKVTDRILEGKKSRS